VAGRLRLLRDVGKLVSQHVRDVLAVQIERAALEVDVSSQRERLVAGRDLGAVAVIGVGRPSDPLKCGP
jgi:hypothetical protein